MGASRSSLNWSTWAEAVGAQLQHSIGKQVVACTVSARGADPYSLQDRICRLCRDVLPQALEAALDRHAPGDAVVRIDRLEIDLGNVNLTRLESELEARLRERLGESLRRLVPGLGENGEAPSAEGRLHAWEAALDWFLRHGSLPGWCRMPPGATLAATLLEHWDSRPSERVTGALAGMLRNALRHSNARQRLLLQFDRRFRRALLERTRSGAVARLDAALDEISRRAASAPGARLLEPAWVAGLALAVEGKPINAMVLADGLVQDSAMPPQVREMAQSFLDRHARAGEQVGSAAARTSAHRAPVPPASVSPRDTETAHPDQATGLYVNHAGIVVLHPFLPRLFEALGISKGADLLLPDRALTMLHFLCTGARQAPEHELVLAKHLCGLPLNAPVDGSAVLTEAECVEADSMLKAVIGHWSALRNTTPDGLRGAFLLRPGKLLERGGEWHLHVQSETADILMNSLPWGVGAVRLPWMKGILWVEWS